MLRELCRVSCAAWFVIAAGGAAALGCSADDGGVTRTPTGSGAATSAGGTSSSGGSGASAGTTASGGTATGGVSNGGQGGASTGGGGSSAGGTGAGGTLPDADRTLLEDVKPRLAALAADGIEFWKTYGPDQTNGGFHRCLDRQGTPCDDSDPGRSGGGSATGKTKALLQQARHLWTFSMWYERREATTEIKAIADDLYAFVTTKMRDGSDGQFYFAVSEDGSSVVDNTKRLYDESFVIYALSTYARVFANDQAKQYALDCFDAIDALHDDTNLGYVVDGNLFYSSGNIKQTNTQIHLMEAFTALYETSQDASVKAALEESVDVVIQKMLQPSGYVHQEFALDWTPTGEARVSYGHDLETAWLLLESARVLGTPNDAAIVDAAKTMAMKSSADGFDSMYGGYAQSGPASGTADDLDKEWWEQFEALAGLLRLYEHTGDATHLTRLESTLDFIEAHLHDAQYGEFYPQTDRSGTATSQTKGNFWKESYHTTRALVFTEDWIDELLQ